MPNVPTLSRTPTSSAAAPAGAAPPASGSQVWNGKNGALIAKARKKPRNSQRSAPASNRRVAERLPVEGVPTEHPQADHRGQHEQAADERVEEELDRRVLAPRAAEGADEEVHRHEHDLEEDVEQEHVGGREDADHGELERQQQREVRRATLAGCRSRPRRARSARMTSGTSTAISASITSAMPSVAKVKCASQVGIHG